MSGRKTLRFYEIQYHILSEVNIKDCTSLNLLEMTQITLQLLYSRTQLQIDYAQLVQQYVSKKEARIP